MARYGGEYMRRARGPYDEDFYGERMTPTPWGGFYPPAYWGGGAVYGLAGGGWAPYDPFTGFGWRAGYDYDAGYRRPRARPPHESPTYGRGGDRELREWARRRRGRYRR